MPGPERRIRLTLPKEGLTRPDIEARLAHFAELDASATRGIKFSRRFFPGEETADLASHAYGLFAQTGRSSPYPDFPSPPSMQTMQREVIHHALALMNAPESADGTITSGGTESVVLAVKGCITRAREQGLNIRECDIIAPCSAHPCIDKAAELFGLKLKRVPVGDDLSADIARTMDALTPKTIMLYGSFPCYPYGLVDDIAALAAIARDRDIWLHVDACMSGFLAPFVRMNGHPIPEFDFRIPGVSSISVDLHKHGYSAKGASLVLYRTRELADYQPFAYADYPLPPMVTPTLAGTAPGAPIASAWAVMNYLGIEGYRRLAGQLVSAREAFMAAISSVRGFAVLGKPLFSILTFGSPTYEIRGIQNELTRRGWFTLPVREPPAIQLNISATDEPLAKEFAADLSAAVVALRAR